MKKLKICVLAGDGIGKEVINSTIDVFKELNIPCQLSFGEIGFECWKKEGNTVPQATWDLIDKSDAVLLGAVTSKPLLEAEKELPKDLQNKGHKFVSPVIQLRQKLGLFANVRPVFDLISKKSRFNFCVIRENTEGLYAGLDFAEIPQPFKEVMIKEHNDMLNWEINDLDKASCTVRLQTAKGLERLFRFAFEYAKSNGFSKVTLADKPNVLRYSGNFAKSILENVAKDYTAISYDIQNIDAVALQMVRKPENYQVIVAENMFGDILSDLGGGIMGGLGFAPSANIGGKKCYFEPVHGSAPKHAGLNKANPSAMFLTISLLLKHYGFKQEALKIEMAVKKVIHEGKYTTYDLGGNSSTSQMAEAIIAGLENNKITKTVSIIATGSELLSGDFMETNSGKISKILHENSIITKSHSTVCDNKNDIIRAIKNGFIESQAVIITGGLGPTSDDNSREAVSDATGAELEFNQESWERIKSRLLRFNIDVDDSNKKQAMFPEDSIIILNENGTAEGSILKIDNTDVILLPGPPRECLPMFLNTVLPYLKEKGYQSDFTVLKWRLIGVIESNIAPQLDKIFAGTSITTSYCLKYPYLDFKLQIPKSIADQINMEQINQIIEEYVVCFNKEGNASDHLSDYIKQKNITLEITDNATKGVLAQKLSLEAANKGEIKFNASINGLNELWENKPFTGTTKIDVLVEYNNQPQNYSILVPYRGAEVKNYAVEYASFIIFKVMNQYL